jgi:hypothetical protein
MTTIDEKEILEIEKLKAELAKLPLEVQKIKSDMKQGNTRNVLLAVAVTVAIMTFFFKANIGI